MPSCVAVLLLGFPDGLQMQPVEFGQHVIHLDGRDAAFLDGVSKHVGHRLYAAEGAEIRRIPRLVLVGTAIVGMDAHDQAGDLSLADSCRGYAAAFQICLHCIPVPDSVIHSIENRT